VAGRRGLDLDLQAGGDVTFTRTQAPLSVFPDLGSTRTAAENIGLALAPRGLPKPEPANAPRILLADEPTVARRAFRVVRMQDGQVVEDRAAVSA
jgi:hypothetical protein